MATASPRLQSVLLETLFELKTKNSSYSLRAFARKIGVSPSLLSQFLAGKKKISTKLAEKIADRLMLDPTTRAEVITKQTIAPRWVHLGLDEFRLISEWQHFAILSLAETKDFKSSTKWIAARLGIAPTLVQKSVDCLVRMGFLTRSTKGRLIATGEQYHSSDGVPNVAGRRALAEDLDIARRSLEEDSIERRDFTSLTIAIDERRIPEAKRLIREFRERFSDAMDTPHKNEVYKLCIQFMPLTKRKSL
jgi:uncharacterized protein (TIGR02147 family)